MAKDLLWRGMFAGLIAALLSALFALTFAEPQIDRAIAYEEAHAAATAHSGMTAAPEEELVSRATQKTGGLFTALALYGSAVGGLFALTFAYAYGRVGPIGPRTLALLLALAAFVLIVLTPAIKYPPTPPAVGQHETVRIRTAAFFGMIALSLLSALAASQLRQTLAVRVDRMTGLLLAGGGYLLLVFLLQHALPSIDEVPRDFPASLLWQFRLASLGAQLVLWASIGVLFGSLAERRLRRR
jgi:predicted cobalt transporter CbtA